MERCIILIAWARAPEQLPTIPSDHLKRLQKEFEDVLPTNCFITKLLNKHGARGQPVSCARCGAKNRASAKFCNECGQAQSSASSDLPIDDFRWENGDGDTEGLDWHTFNDIFLRCVVPLIKGRAELVMVHQLVDECDDADVRPVVDGMLIEHGQVRFHDVTFANERPSPFLRYAGAMSVHVDDFDDGADNKR